jgi:hypothetical protein
MSLSVYAAHHKIIPTVQIAANASEITKSPMVMMPAVALDCAEDVERLYSAPLACCRIEGL